MIGLEKVVSGLPSDLVIPLPGNGFPEPTGGGAKFLGWSPLPGFVVFGLVLLMIASILGSLYILSVENLNQYV